MLAAQHQGDLRSETTKHNTVRIDHVPFTFDGFGLRDIRAHWDSSKSISILMHQA